MRLLQTAGEAVKGGGKVLRTAELLQSPSGAVEYIAAEGGRVSHVDLDPPSWNRESPQIHGLIFQWDLEKKDHLVIL